MPEKKIRLFKKHRNAEQVKQAAAEKGWQVEEKPFGLDDWMMVMVDLPGCPDIDYVMYDPSRGQFIGDGFTSNQFLDGNGWFDALMDFFYMDEELPA